MAIVSRKGSISKKDIIWHFRGRHSFLSNFTWCDVDLNGVTYPSTEHAYQAAKTLRSKDRRAIKNAETFYKAKALGRRVKLRDKWDIKRVKVMRNLLRQKFSQPYFREKLLATGNAKLIEGNTWGDDFWGVTRGGKGEGRNILGKLLMQIRREARKQSG